MDILQNIKSYFRKGNQASTQETGEIWKLREIDEAMPMPVREREKTVHGSADIYTHLLENYQIPGVELEIKGSLESREIKISGSGKNLYNGNKKSCYLKKDILKEYGKMAGIYQTTEWFPIDAAQRYLNMTGDGFNRAVWQFRNEQGGLLGVSQPDKMEKYRVVNQKQYDRSCAKVEIPPEAVEARVYFAKLNDTDCALLGENLQIAYGLIPEYYEEYYGKCAVVKTSESTKAIRIGEKSIKLLDKDGSVIEEQACDFEWKKIACIHVDGVGECKAAFVQPFPQADLKPEKEREYGIRWKMDDPVPLCERIGDAAWMHFNYMVEGDWAGNYPNDFDWAYPWNQIRTCAVAVWEDGTRKICYEGEDGFARDGSAGEVMVEIPAYYAKREQKDGYEYLWITGSPKEGYELDPSFITETGKLEHVYMSAYLGSETDKKVHSRSKTYVTLRRNMKEYLKMIDSGHGYEAYDLLLHLTVQRLFLIETAVLDSQSVFDGVVYLPYKVMNTKTAYYALETHKSVNEIIVKDTPITRRLLPGDSATVLVQWKDYQNTPEYQRTVIESTEIEEGRLKIRFSGSPIDVYREKTAISALPRRNGDTDSLLYHTARGNKNHCLVRGHESFRYRGIENLWGGAWVNFGNCYVKNSRLYLDYPDKTSRVLGYELPVQNVILTSKQFGSPMEMCVKKMGYDKENPLLMLPVEIGNGASTNTYYCDAWYNIAEKDTEYLLCYGGAWDNLGYAGIFCYRANYVMKDKIPL